MAITVQSVLNLSDSSASPSQGYVSTPDSPFAMFFASQLQAFSLGQPGVTPVSDSTMLDGIGQQRAATTAQDASSLLGGLFMAGGAAANPLAGAAGKDDKVFASLADPAALAEAQAAEELAALAGSKGKTVRGEAGAIPAELVAMGGEMAREEAPVQPGLLVASSNSKRLLKDDGLSAAVAVRLAMREAEAAEAGSEVKTLPPAVAAGRQELPTDLAAAATGKESKEVLLGGTMDRSKQWGEAFSQQVVKAVERQLDSARFHVTPEKLGPIEVQISMNKEQAQIVVTTSNLMAKEIVESHLPALSRMMEQAGLQLADAQVSSQQQGHQQQGQQAQQQRSGSGAEVALLPGEAEPAVPVATVASGLSVTA